MELDLSEYRWPLIALAAILLLAGRGVAGLCLYSGRG